MYKGVSGRQKSALIRLQLQLEKGTKPTKITDLVHHQHVSEQIDVELNDDDKNRIKSEIKILNDRVNGTKKIKKNRQQANENKEDKWNIEIYTVSYGYVKNSERRKNKGKSKKKLKRVKTVSLLRTVVAQPGMINSYKEGRMGLSPKTHVFKLKRDIPSYF